ncbi:hypothetical protein [Pantoea vagans]|nr:hypothetical protein [Pantoea vagans]
MLITVNVLIQAGQRLFLLIPYEHFTDYSEYQHSRSTLLAYILH